jgi:hypothetical protein
VPVKDPAHEIGVVVVPAKDSVLHRGTLAQRGSMADSESIPERGPRRFQDVDQKRSQVVTEAF